MSTNIKDAKNGASYPPMDAGTYLAVCCGVIDLGRQKTSYEGVEREANQLLLMWEFPDELIEYNGEMKPRWISRAYTFSVSEKARLRNDLKTWRGCDFTNTELSDFDIAKVIGAPCLINVTNTTKNGITYANMAGVMKLSKGMSVRPPTRKMHFDMDNPETWGVFSELPEWIQTKINDSLTFHEKGIRLDKDSNVFDLNTMPPGDSADAYGEIAAGYSDESDLPF